MEKLELKNLQIKYEVLSVKYLPQLQADIDLLYSNNKMSKNEVFCRYTDRLKFALPEDFPDAKYIIVMAIEHNNAIVNFHLDNSVQRIILSYPYHNLATTPEDLKDLIIEEIIRSKDYRVEHNRSMFLKRLAARSGLGRYGRNNIFYVNGLGSFLSIYTFFTDYDFKKEENWHEVKMLNECTNCHICFNNCPTKAISRDDFVIDVEKCLSLYNEIQGIIPDWIDSSAHNSLMGCTKCQVLCPANKLVVDKFIKLEDITKEESKMILNGEQDEELAASIGKKLHMFDAKYAYYFIPIIKRNLELLLK